MNLYLIETERDVYSTNAESKTDVIEKFKVEYPDYEILGVKEIDVSELNNIVDNDKILFF